MNRYLQIVRKTLPGYERNEINERTPPQLPALPLERKALVLTVTGTQKEMAEIVGKQRVESNNSTRKPNQDAGAAGNYSRDYYGSLAEIVVRQWLEAQGVITASALVSDRPDKQADLVLNGYRIEVKSSRPGYNALAINQEQHLTRTPPANYYLPCLFDAAGESIAIMSLVPHREVSDWSQAMGRKGSLFYHAPRAGLMPLYSLLELFSVTMTDAVIATPKIASEPERQEEPPDDFNDLLSAAQEDALPKGYVDFDEPDKASGVNDLKKYVLHTYKRYRRALHDKKTGEAKEHASNLRLCHKAWKAEE